MEIKEFTLLLNPRLFKIGHRIKVFYKNKWRSGTVNHFVPWRWCEPKIFYETLKKHSSKYEMVEEDKKTGKITYDDYTHAHMYMRLDEKIGEDTDLLNGYGLKSISGGYDIIFEYEQEYDPPPPIFLAKT